jgi:hypothetical protein
MKTIELAASDAVSVASLIHAANSGSDAKITPVLSEVFISVIDGKLTAAATDRYTAAIYDTEATGPDTEFRLSAAACKFITANVKRVSKHYSPQPVEFTIDQESREVAIRHERAVFSDVWQPAKYPGIVGLVEGWQPADTNHAVKLRGEFLARLYKFIDAFTKVDYWVMQVGRGSDYRPDRPGAVMATAGKFRVLIMPNVYNPADTI